MLNQDFKEFIQLLNDNQVRYLVVGGYAVALHGHPRYTKDIDVWIELAQENASHIIKALEQFGFASLGLKENDFLVEDQIIQLGYLPNRIDIITSSAWGHIRRVLRQTPICRDRWRNRKLHRPGQPAEEQKSRRKIAGSG